MNTLKPVNKIVILLIAVLHSACSDFKSSQASLSVGESCIVTPTSSKATAPSFANEKKSVAVDTKCLLGLEEKTELHEFILNNKNIIRSIKEQNFVIPEDIDVSFPFPACVVSAQKTAEDKHLNLSLDALPSNGDWSIKNSDPKRSSQNYMDYLDLEDAHEIFYDKITDAEVSGKQVTVAIIDSGVYSGHEDLKNQMVAGYDFAEDDNDPDDGNGHGTHVSGFVAAEGHNNKGIKGGAAYGVKLMPLRVLDDSGSLSSSVMDERLSNAIRYAVDNGAEVINMSLSAPISSSNNQAVTAGDKTTVRIKEALEYATGKGVTVIVTASNDGKELNDSYMRYPARYGSVMDGVISVGSYDSGYLDLSSFSNYSSEYVEISAPGSYNEGGILSTDKNGGYSYKGGTSMSAPLVSGLAALIRLYAKRHDLSLTASQMESLVKTTAKKLNDISNLIEDGNVINYLQTAELLEDSFKAGVIKQPESYSVKEGQDVSLFAELSYYEDGTKFQWYKDGQALSGADKINLDLKNIKNSDVGQYQLQIEFPSTGKLLKTIKSYVTIGTSHILCP